MRTLAAYGSVLWLISGINAILIPGLSPIISDMMNRDKSQPGAPQTPELLEGSPWCVQAYKIQRGDSCFSIAQQHGIATGQIRQWSPVVRSHGCGALPVGARICVAVANEPEALVWTNEKQSRADEDAGKRKNEEERNKLEKQDQERKDRKKKKEQEEKTKAAEEMEKKKMPMWRDGKIRFPEPREGHSYPIVFYGRGSRTGSSTWGYCQYVVDGPNMVRQPKYIDEYCDDRCKFWSWEKMGPMGERFVPKSYVDRAMGEE